MDYLLYDSGGLVAGNPGDLVVFVNQGTKGFGPPQGVNTGFDYRSHPDLQRLEKLIADAQTHAIAAKTASILCKTATTELLKTIPCTALIVEVVNASSTAEAIADAGESFLNASPDALPEDQARITELRALATAEKALAWLFVATPYLLPPGTAEVLNDAAQLTEKAGRVTQHTVRRLDYRSRINALTKGFSEMDGSNSTQSANGISAQTAGLIDFNGDVLPDMVITRDREGKCSQDQWEVFWGIGTSEFSNGQAFTKSSWCIDVPRPPSDVASRGYTTLPLHVEMIRRQPAGLLGSEIDAVQQTYVTLFDFNQDGRPDLLLANSDTWDPSATSRTWSVCLNNGSGFDFHPLKVKSGQASLLDVQPASAYASGLDVPYPTMRSSHTETGLTLSRDRSDLHAGFVDVDGDGVSDLARRVKHSPVTDPSGTTTWRAGLLMWSRAGSAPQDLLIEERRPIEGSRILAEYKAAPLFQWEDAIPDGQPPESGHHPAGATAGYLVRSVTMERLMGRPEQRTRLGYDYRFPYFDPQDRLPAAFAWRSTSSLDPVTGDPIPDSVVTIQRDAQRSEAIGGVTHIQDVVRATGAPVQETLTSYEDRVIASAGPGPTRAMFSAPVSTLTVEYPEGLKSGPTFDVGFDGRRPLANRANRAIPLPNSSSGMVFDAVLPTGGGMTLSSGQWVEIPSPVPELNLGKLTIEAWVNPSSTPSRGIIARHPDGYELAVESSGEVTFGINIGGAWVPRVTGGPLPVNTWSHVVASYDGIDLRIFVNTELKGVVNRPGPISYPPTPSGAFRIGCAEVATTGQNIECFVGSLGELRIYPEAWKSQARITQTKTEYQTDWKKPNFGMPVRTWDYGDIATLKDDVYIATSYAVPLSGSEIQNAVATTTRHALGPDGKTLAGILGYSEIYYDQYDGLVLGQVKSGNPTMSGVYSGPSGVVVPSVKADIFSHMRYLNPDCPGVVTETEDPEGAVTKTTYDPTCTFPLTTTNALGHAVTNEYFGVNGVGYANLVDQPSQLFFRGFYGQIRSVTDANGGITLSNYDEWSRVITAVGPYDTPTRPAAITKYADALCKEVSGTIIACDKPNATELSSPPRVTVSNWDDTQHDYRITHTFADGQIQAEVVNKGEPDWLISGTQDYDGLGRVIATYKPRYLPAVKAPTVDSCPPAGTWCDSEKLKGDPLRDPAVVAHVQTAYDSRGRVIRTYGPDVPACPDPSARDALGNLLCDQAAKKAIPQGHFTQFEFPAPGVVRTIDARGVPSVVQNDVHGRVKRVEEYMQTSSVPYATSDYEYDPDGRVLMVKDTKGNTTTATYDCLGQKLSSTDPDMGTWKYQYDKRGQLLTQEDATGALLKNKYDILGRLIRQEHYSPPRTHSVVCNKPVIPEKQPNKKEIPELPYDVNLTIPWTPCQWVGPNEYPVLGTNICDGPYPGSRGNPWRHGPQFSNQKDFIPKPNAWEQIELTPLLLVAGDLDNGVALLELPFEFALGPADLLELNDGEVVLADPLSDTELLPAGSPILINTNGKVRFGSMDDIETELESFDNTQLSLNDQRALYPLWDDLVMSERRGGLSYAVVEAAPRVPISGGRPRAVLGAAPERRLVIQWEGAYRSDPESRVLFRAILSEGTYAVEYQYHTLSLGSSSATIGLQNAGLRDIGPIEYSVNRDSVTSGQALTSMRRVGNNVLQFSPDMLDGAAERLRARFAIEVDLTGETEAVLSFKHSWNTRCADYPQGNCPVDNMTVMYAVKGETGMFPLLTGAELTMQSAYKAGLDSMENAPMVSVSLPERALGKTVYVVFAFDSRDALSLKDSAYRWKVDDVQICGETTRVLEDVVEWRYDSAEPMFSYDSSKPALDLTFDVPGRVVDRSPLKNEVTAKAIGSGRGISGAALRLDGITSNVISHLEIPSKKFTPFAKALTVEGWIKPTSPTGPPVQEQTLLRKSGTFALTRDLSGHLHCYVDIGAGLQGVKSAGIVPSDTWTHVALTYDGANTRCYINGAEEGVLPLSGTLGWNTDPLFVGAGASGDPFTGLIDELRIFPTVRPAADILADAASPLQHGPPRGNVLDLGFTDPQNRGADTSGAGNHSTAVCADPTPGIRGTAMRFDSGVDSCNSASNPQPYVRAEDADSLGSDELTAEVWLKTQTTEDRLLVGKWNGSSPGWRLAMNEGSGQVRFEVRTRVSTPEAWTTWADDTSGLSPQGNGWCGSSDASPTALKSWVAPATGKFTFSTVSGATWDTVIFIRDAGGNQVDCNDNALGSSQSSVSIDAVQGDRYQIFQSGANGDSGAFTMTVTGPNATSTSFVTRERVNNGRWRHIAGTYDGESLRVYIDGEPAHRTCREPEREGPEGSPGTSGGAEIPCERPPEEKCAVVEWEEIDNRLYPNAVCVVGSIINTLPVYIGNYDPQFFPNHASLEGMEDEVRVSNYAKRDFEVAGSARLYSAYTATVGQLVEMRNRTTTENYSYDLLGRRVSVNKRTTLQVPGKAPIVGQYLSRSAYDNLGRTSSLRYPDGEVAVSSYDRGGIEVSLVGYGNFEGYDVLKFGKQPYLLEADVTATGRIERLLFGNQGVSTYSYDEGHTKNPNTGNFNTNGTFGNELLAEQVTTLPGNETLQDQHYEYDPVGNLLKREDFTRQPLRNPPLLHSAPLTSTYTYDDLSRLKSFETHLGATLAASGSYSYDALGNLLLKEGANLDYGTSLGALNCGRAATTTLPHAVTRVQQPGATTEYCYDANGRLAETRVGGTVISTFLHDIWGKISRMTNATGTFFFTYDGNGERIHKVEPSGVTTEPFGFYRETSKGTEKYYFADGRRIARRTGVGKTDVSWYHPEHLGSTNFMTGADGAEIQDAYSEYTPFGSPLPNKDNNTSGPHANKNTPIGDRSGGFQFNGKELDDTGLYYYGARYYDPSIGRFLEPDTTVPELSTQALNRYSYVLNNPLKYIDPDGHSPAGSHVRLLGEEDYLRAEMKSKLELQSGRCGVVCPEVGLSSPPSECRGPTLRAATPNLDPNKGVFRPIQLELMYGAVRKPLVLAMGGPAAAPLILTASATLNAYEGSVLVSQGDYLGGGIALTSALLESSFAGSLRVPSLGVRISPREPARIYSARELMRRAEELGPYHNFPESFNQYIFQGSKTVISENYSLYTARGAVTLPGEHIRNASGQIIGRTGPRVVQGTYEIGVKPSQLGGVETITHRFFRADKK